MSKIYKWSLQKVILCNNLHQMKRNTHYESIFCGESNNINHTFSVNMIFLSVDGQRYRSFVMVGNVYKRKKKRRG